ncbi:MAG: 2Fe-2S iron-sulfur cluster-binding protein [Polyangiaceae bacterium]
MAKIRISGTQVELSAESGADLLEALQEIGYPIATSCGGRASCGLCRLTIVSGREVLSPINNEEVGHLGNVAKIIGLRLACQARIVGDGELVVEVPTVEDVEARKRQKAERIQRERAQQRGRGMHAAGASAFGASRDHAPAPGAATPGVRRPPASTPEHKSRESSGKTEWRPRKLGSERGGSGDR